MSALQLGLLVAVILAVVATLYWSSAKTKRGPASSGIVPNEWSLALIRLLGRARFHRMHRVGEIDALEANASIKQIATLPAPVLMGLPEATILWICSEYLRLTEAGSLRPQALATIEAHRASLSSVNLTPSIRTRWLRSYVADRVVAEHSEIAYSQDFAMLATEYLMNRLPKPLASKDGDIETIHPMATPIPFGVLESAQLVVETLQSAIESLDRKNPTEALVKINSSLAGPDAAVLRDADRRDLLEKREKIATGTWR